MADVALLSDSRIAIRATDIAEVIGMAVSLDILLHILIAGVILTSLDVVIVLMAYRRGKGMIDTA